MPGYLLAARRRQEATRNHFKVGLPSANPKIVQAPRPLSRWSLFTTVDILSTPSFSTMVGMLGTGHLLTCKIKRTDTTDGPHQKAAFVDASICRRNTFATCWKNGRLTILPPVVSDVFCYAKSDSVQNWSSLVKSRPEHHVLALVEHKIICRIGDELFFILQTLSRRSNVASLSLFQWQTFRRTPFFSSTSSDHYVLDSPR